MNRDEHSVWDEPSTPGGSGPVYACERCGYDLRGTVHVPVCPECGMALGEAEPGGSRSSLDERAEHSVWNEPGMRGRAPDGAVSFRSRLLARIESTTLTRTWVVTLFAALIAGPFAVFGAFWGSGQTWSGVLSLTVFGPVVEEVMKIGAALMIVELAPYLFRSKGQILLAAFVSGLAFAAIENVMYLKIYIPDPSDSIVWWRWTVCVALHSGCSLIAGMGVARVWGAVMRDYRRADVGLGAGYLILATIIHGTYNGSMLALELSDFQF